MSLFRLYRIQVFQEQRDFLEPYPGGAAVLGEAIFEPLKLELKTRRYFAASFSRIDDQGVYFKFARKRIVKTIEFENDESIELEHEDNPFVEVVIDHALELCAISKNGKFASETDFSAARLRELLLLTPTIKKHHCDVVLDPIRDPADFLHFLTTASVIQKFYFETRRPNPIDADSFIKPLKELNQEAKAKKSRTSLEGTNLNKDILLKFTRAAASTGDDAGARLRLPHMKSFVNKSLGKSAIEFEWNGESLNQLIGKIRGVYKKVRDGLTLR
jgi:hypothetical protein